MTHLKDINSPEDLRKLTYEEKKFLAEEIRERIITTTNINGGHLASNLGVVEITLALHSVFNTPTDKVVFDVGHQTYTHKLVTGRNDRFDTIRQYKGLSGFPKIEESEYDVFETGHASTAISASLGLARARDLKNEDYNVISVVGDGALTGGMCYEALNDAGHSQKKFIVILNDNAMSISQNVGAVSKYLTELRTSHGYNLAKKTIRKGAIVIPIIGPLVHFILHGIKTIIKPMIINENYFSPMGFHYIGPIDGHDIETLEKVFKKAKLYDEPVLIHCCTKKGFGDKKAENRPEKYHGVSPVVKTKKNEYVESNMVSAGSIASNKLCDLMEKDKNIVVITAAMAEGTCTNIIKEKFPKRFFDVGITEEHAVTLAAGMARAGLHPYFFVYSTFLQRCYDQIIHDVYLQKLNVTFVVDRAGFASQDGATHHGIYDIGFLHTMKNLTIVNPLNAKELKEIIEYSTTSPSSMVIRYAKQVSEKEYNNNDFELHKWKKIVAGTDCVIVSYGSMLLEILNNIKILTDKNISASIFNASTISPIDDETIRNIDLENRPVFVIEEHMSTTGLGSIMAMSSIKNNLKIDLHCIGIENSSIQQGSMNNLLNEAGLLPQQIFESIESTLKKDMK